MKLDDEILATLHHDLNVCRNYIRQVSQGMLKGNVSKYPIFVAIKSQPDIDLGLPIINREELELTWSVNASHLEDFVNTAIIQEDKLNVFMKNYKDPKEFMCVFVAEEGMMSFIFMPYDNKHPPQLDVSKVQLN